MGRTTLFAALGAGICALTALSCSGGGGGGTGAPPAAATSSVSSGVITGLSSVKLNGQEYHTPNTSFTVDGQPGAENDLKLGMVVTVNGSLSSSGTRTAATITQEDVVEGAIQAIPATNDRLVVLGQTVLIDNGTVFDNDIPGGNLGGLSVGNLVEVNGFVRGKGVTIATLIEKKNPPAACEVKGIIENHNSGAQTFTIGSLSVNYSGALINDMLNPADNAWNDLLVEVKGNPCTRLSQLFVATKVEPERINVANADEIELEGVITQFTSPPSFTVNGVPVVTNANTVFERGEAGDLALGVEVEVEGSLANGILTATEVKFRDNVRIEGNAATVTPGGATPNLTISGLPGVTVFVNAQTEFKGGISSLGQLAAGDHVRVRGRPAGTNTVIAEEVERRSPDTRVILQGPVQSVANPMVTILGVVIDTSPIADGDFKGTRGAPNGRAAFFAAVTVGTEVKARGKLSGGVVLWDEIEIEREGQE
jgi:Domain of unknown function (DUF5666)